VHGAAVAGALAAGSRTQRAVLVRTAAAAIIGLAALAPYLWQVSAGGVALATHASPSFAPRGLVSAAYAGAFLLLPAWFALRGREHTASLQGMLVALVLPACALGVPGENQSKLLNLAFVLAAAPAACAWARAIERPAWRTALAGLLVASQLPTLLALLCAYALESPASLDAPSRPPGAILAAVRTETSPDAVLEDMTLDEQRGAAPALPGETGRALLWGGTFMAHKWGLDVEALKLRRDAAARGEWPADTAAAATRSRRPLWIVFRDDSARTADLRWRVAARAEGIVLARLQ